MQRLEEYQTGQSITFLSEESFFDLVKKSQDWGFFYCTKKYITFVQLFLEDNGKNAIVPLKDIFDYSL